MCCNIYKAFVDWWVVVWFLYIQQLKKMLHDVLIFIPYLDNRFVWWTHSFMIWFLWIVVNITLFMFTWTVTVINTVLVNFQFGQRIKHWMLFFSICSVSSNLWCFFNLRWRELHSSIFRFYAWLCSKRFLFNSRALGFASKFFF